MLTSTYAACAALFILWGTNTDIAEEARNASLRTAFNVLAHSAQPWEDYEATRDLADKLAENKINAYSFLEKWTKPCFLLVHSFSKEGY